MKYIKKNGFGKILLNISINLCKFRLYNNIELLCEIVNFNNIYLG